MNWIEKMGLVLTIFGFSILCALFVLGSGDAAAATRLNGEAISALGPVVFIIMGMIAFLFGDQAL